MWDRMPRVDGGWESCSSSSSSPSDEKEGLASTSSISLSIPFGQEETFFFPYGESGSSSSFFLETREESEE